MALPAAVQGGKRPSLEVTWLDQAGEACDLSGVTEITARLQSVQSGEAIDSDGVFTILDAAAGVFEWAYGDEDVGTAGEYRVQFRAVYGVEPSPALTFAAAWTVEPAL